MVYGEKTELERLFHPDPTQRQAFTAHLHNSSTDRSGRTMSAENCCVEYCTVKTSDGVKLHTRIFNPEKEDSAKDNFTVVLVHPYSILGGCQALLRGIASGLASEGYIAVTFDMRGVGRSTGKASLTGFNEIEDAIAVCKWASHNLSADRILLVGSSAGAPIAGSAVDKVEQVIGYVSLGYPFGLMSSILFGRHHKAVLKSPKPKLFVMGLPALSS